MFRSSYLSWLAGLCIILGALPDVAHAQISGDASTGIISQAQINPLLLLRQRLSQGGLAAAAIPLEGVVDENSYVVGPGDSFSISVSGRDATAGPILVSIDGRILLPDAGAVLVGGKTLAEARKIMISALEVSFSNAALDVMLVQSRQFYVHVSGAVPTPGRYLALPVARVSSVLEFAFADTTSAPVTNPTFRPSLRNIELRRSDGTRIEVDLIRYFSAGDTRANPYLADGDVIFVPTHDPDYGSISVGGYIAYPGTYDFKEGDTLLEMIQIAGGLAGNDAVSGVRVLRSSTGPAEAFSFSPAEATGEKGAAFALQALDVISVVRTDAERGLVSVEGRIHFPGTYPIIDGITTLRQVIDAAGGLRSDALLRGAYLERKSLPDAADVLAIGRFENGSNALVRMLSADTTAILQRLRLTDMDFLSRSYFAQELHLQNRVSIDVESVLALGADPVALRSGDRVVIPRDMNTVYVFGQVIKPGYLPLESGRAANYYIAQAGGTSEFAEQIFVLNPATGKYSSDTSHEVFSGDVIFVDRLVDIAGTAEMQTLLIQERSAKSSARIGTIQAVFQSVGTLVTVVALIISIRRN